MHPLKCGGTRQQQILTRKILLIQCKMMSEEDADRDSLVAKLTEIRGLNHLVYTQVTL
jgi:hypothetical protein